MLIEGESKRSGNDLRGRNDGNVVCVFPKKGEVKKGDYVTIKILRSTQTSLIGEIID